LVILGFIEPHITVLYQNSILNSVKKQYASNLKTITNQTSLTNSFARIRALEAYEQIKNI